MNIQDVEDIKERVRKVVPCNFEGKERIVKSNLKDLLEDILIRLKEIEDKDDNIIKKLFKFRLGDKIYKIGDTVKCETDWNLYKADFEGVIVYDYEDYTFNIEGIVTDIDGVKHKRSFPINECYNFK